MVTVIERQDPRTIYPQPPFPAESQPPPGTTSQMKPEPDYGEQTYRGSGKLLGRTAIVTGADSGIGRATALAFAREGADVLISYLNEDADANETKRLVEEAGRVGITVSGDIRNEEHCQWIVQHALDEFGRLDILVNNAAYQMTYPSVTELSAEEFDKTFRTNVYGMFYLCRAALKQMESGGAIVNTASVQAYQPSPTLLAYAATKGAIVNFTKALAVEAIEHGVRVNAVAPGPVWTPLIPSTLPKEAVAKFGGDTLLKRPAQPAELAPVYVLLASPEASYITGMVYGITGGAPID